MLVVIQSVLLSSSERDLWGICSPYKKLTNESSGLIRMCGAGTSWCLVVLVLAAVSIFPVSILKEFGGAAFDNVQRQIYFAFNHVTFSIHRMCISCH